MQPRGFEFPELLRAGRQEARALAAECGSLCLRGVWVSAPSLLPPLNAQFS